MNNIVSCRVCFADSVKMHMVINTPLKELYEKLANVKCGPVEGRLTILCYLCYARLQRCYFFQRDAHRAETLLTNMYYKGGLTREIQSTMTLNYSVTPVRYDYISDPLEIEQTWIHEESERDDNGESSAENKLHAHIEVKRERDSNGESSDEEVGPRNIHIHKRYTHKSDTPHTSWSRKRASSPPERKLFRKRKTAHFHSSDAEAHILAETTAVASTSAAVCTNHDFNEVPLSVDNEVFDYASDEDDKNIHEERLEQELVGLNSLNQDQEKIIEKIDQANDRLLTNITPTDFIWEYDDHTFFVTREVFKEKGGPTFNTKELNTPLDSFLKMVEPDFVDTLVERSNKCAKYTIEDLKRTGKLGENSRLRRWHPTDREEMYRFLGLLICQGLYPNPIEGGYWNGLGSMSVFKDCITFHRFVLLKRFLNFTEPQATKERLYQIKPVIDYFRERFSKLFYPNQEVVIDETLLKRKGRELARKISPKAQLTVKTFELCDSKTGYIWKFFIHAGVLEKESQETKSLSVKIILDLTEDLFNKGHTVIIDNLYNSPLLARYLKSKGVDTFGTVRLTRQFIPEDLKLAKNNMGPGDLVSGHTQDVCIQIWKDSNVVAMISTYHPPDDKQGKKPTVVIDYSSSLHGVDRKDQMLNSQPIERCRNVVWYKKVFRRLLNTAIFNSYVIYQSKDPKISHRVYRECLVSGLLDSFKPLKPETEVLKALAFKKGKKAYTRTLLTHNHFPVKTGTRSTRCTWCTDRQKETGSRSSYKCMECNVCLCIDKCFIEFHTLPDV